MYFRDITLTDISIINQYVSAKGLLSCQLSGAGLWHFAPKYKTKIACGDDFLYIKQQRPGLGQVYFMPVGCGDEKKAIGHILDYHAEFESGAKITFWGITDETKDEFQKAIPKSTLIPDRDWAEYIYEAKALASLTGRKLHRQRNKLNRFMIDNDGKYAYEPISMKNKDEILNFQSDNLKSRIEDGTEDAASLIEEHDLIVNALSHYHEMGLLGGALRVDSQICAFGFGAAITGKIFDYICEKADRKVAGASLMLQRELILNNLTDFTLINREEDLGIAGLRQYKERLKPHILLMKYTAFLEY